MRLQDVISAIGEIAQIGAPFTPAPFGMILGLVSKWGAPAAIKMIEGLDKDEITEDDIKMLHDLVKPPENYFT